MDLAEFAVKQTEFLARMAAEYVTALKADVLLRMDYANSDDCLKRSLSTAVQQGNPYARGVSASELRREIEAQKTGPRH